MSYRPKIEEEPFEYEESEDTLELADDDQKDFEDLFESEDSEMPDTKMNQEDFEDNFELDVLELPDTEQEVVGTSGLRIEDRTNVARKDRRKGRRDPSTVKALVLHQMAFSRGNNPDRYNQVTAHYAILPNGRILQLHPVSALLWASNGFNRKSVAVEFAGNFPNVRGKCWEAGKYGCHKLSQAQIEAGRFLVKHLIKKIGLTHIFAHRQAASTRENCPGPDIWYHVGHWAVTNLRLKDGGLGYKIGLGNPIPDSWRNRARATAKEFETYPESSEDFESFEYFEDQESSITPGYTGMEFSDHKDFKEPETWEELADQATGSQFEDTGLLELDSEQSNQQASFYKDSSRLKASPLKPGTSVTINPKWTSVRKSLARTYNRLGGLMRAAASELRIEAETALAVWQIESGGRSHTTGKAIIRFENHLFYKLWGKSNQNTYNQYFRHGGHNGMSGKSWHNHQFRENVTEAFKAFHGNQALEYRVLSLASRLAGEDIALRCISIGGPQILVANYRLIGYSSPRAMYDAFQASERAHVLGFFDFCKQKKAPKKGYLIKHLREHKWSEFAKYYNGFGQYEKYGSRIGNSYSHAKQILA